MKTQHSPNLGNLIEGEEYRDAIHIACAPLVASETLLPGVHVGLDERGQASSRGVKTIGVVDPFLRDAVQPGQKFWMLLYPGAITALRHEWMHPSFTDEALTKDQSEKEKSKAWLKQFAESTGADYDDMMDIASTHCQEGEYGDYLIQGGRWEGQGTPDEFWTHFEVITGKKPTSKYGLPGIFSCSC